MGVREAAKEAARLAQQTEFETRACTEAERALLELKLRRREGLQSSSPIPHNVGDDMALSAA